MRTRLQMRVLGRIARGICGETRAHRTRIWLEGEWPVAHDLLYEVFVERVDEILVRNAKSGGDGDRRVGVPTTHIEFPVERDGE